MIHEEARPSDTKALLILFTALAILMLPIVALDYILSWTTRYQSWPWVTVSVSLAFFELIYVLALGYTLIKELLWPLTKSLIKDIRTMRRDKRDG